MNKELSLSFLIFASLKKMRNDLKSHLSIQIPIKLFDSTFIKTFCTGCLRMKHKKVCKKLRKKYTKMRTKKNKEKSNLKQPKQ